MLSGSGPGVGYVVKWWRTPVNRRAAVKKQIVDQVYDPICNQIRDLIERQVWGQSRGAAWLRVSYQVGVGDHAEDQVGGQVWHRIWVQAKEDIDDANGSTSRV
jgi:hypothetical protein